MKRILLGAGACLMAQVTMGSGFSLYEPSTVSHAMGGALVGKAMDASANFNNPATLTDLTNIQFTVGFVTEHPRGRVKTGRDDIGHSTHQLDPGLFWLPHFQLAVPLPCDFAFGLGVGADYGLGTQYSLNSGVDWSSRKTTIEGLVVNPNLAYKITDKWSVAAGLRWLYFDFDQFSNPQVVQNGVELARFQNHLHGDNDFRNFGWQIGTKYDITDTLSVGFVYKSYIDVNVKGKTSNHVRSWNEPGVAALSEASVYQSMRSKGYSNDQIALLRKYQPKVYEKYVSQADATVRETVSGAARSRTGRARCDLRVPQTFSGGINWDAHETWHLGAAVSWTQWSELENLHFDLEGGDKDISLKWNDTWRFSLGSCWDFARDWKWMISYTYDMDSTSYNQESLMLPPADRHILATGFAWQCWKGLELAASYSCIFMDGDEMRTHDALGRRYDAETRWGVCHAVGFSVTYRF